MANSNLKANSAKLTIAENNDYGSAISLLIISNEEAVKALMLFLEGNDFRLRNIPGFTNLFENHRLRYLVIPFNSDRNNIPQRILEISILLFFQNPGKSTSPSLKWEPSAIINRFNIYFLRFDIAVIKKRSRLVFKN